MKIKTHKLKREIERKGITQRVLGDLAGVSRQTVNGICRGRECSQATAQRIAQALGVPLYEIIER